MSQFIAQTLKNIPGVDPRLAQRAQAFSGLNDGPAETAARLAGLVQKDDAKDDSPLSVLIRSLCVYAVADGLSCAATPETLVKSSRTAVIR